MKTQPARYSVMFGLAGCYMPDSFYGTFECHTRRDLARMIREALAAYDMPASKFRDVNISKLWGFIAHNGASSCHFHIYHGVDVLSFTGLTTAEYAEASQDD